MNQLRIGLAMLAVLTWKAEKSSRYPCSWRSPTKIKEVKSADLSWPGSLITYQSLTADIWSCGGLKHSTAFKYLAGFMLEKYIMNILNMSQLSYLGNKKFFHE